MEIWVIGDFRTIFYYLIYICISLETMLKVIVVSSKTSLCILSTLSSAHI